MMMTSGVSNDPIISDYNTQQQKTFHISTSISGGNVTHDVIADYIKSTKTLFKQEYNYFSHLNSFKAMSPERNKQWTDLAMTLSMEESPWMLPRLEVKGTHPAFYAVALKLFLKSSEYAQFLEDNTTHSCSKAFHEIEKKLQSLLKPYINTLIAIGALRLLPDHYADKLPEVIFNWLSKVIKLNYEREILYPISWLLPSRGHFLLNRISLSSPGTGIKIDIFDATRKSKDKSIANYTQQTPTAFSLTKEITLTEQLTVLSKIAPMEIPKRVAGFALGAGSDRIAPETEEIAENRCKQIAYEALAQGWTEVKPSGTNPLQYTSREAGANCVVASFRMLLLTLADDCAREMNLNDLDQLRLKELCSAFLAVFKNHAAIKMNIY